MLTVSGSLQRAEGVLRVMPPKTERSKRAIPLPTSILSRCFDVFAPSRMSGA